VRFAKNTKFDDSARERAELRDERFLGIRRTFASRLVQAGIPLYEVMHLTGHKSLEMVQRYAHLAPDYADRAIQALNAIGHDLDTLRSGLRAQKPFKTKEHP
jgi:integrase